MVRSKTEVDKVVPMWLRSDGVAKLSAGTRKQYARVARRITEARQSGTLPRYVHELLPMHISELMVALRAGDPNGGNFYRTIRPRNGAAANIDRGILRNFATFLTDNGLHTINVASGLVNAKRVRHNRFVDLSLDREETEALLAYAAKRHPRDRMMVAAGIFVGMRESEIRDLRVRDVNLHSRAVDFKRQKMNGEYLLSRLSPPAAHEFRQYLAWYSDVYGPLSPDMYVLPAKPRGTPPRSSWRGGFIPLRPHSPATNIKVQLMTMLKAIGKPQAPGQGAHILRRTCGAMMIDAGADIRDVQEALGHATVQQTEDYLCQRVRAERLDARYQDQEFVSKMWGYDPPPPPVADNVFSLDERRRHVG